ncbi:hypothetical protein PIB30_115253, partial [Stylosanthes scabra]|nr:hypothetical protein [Stylosanthes scabra]
RFRQSNTRGRVHIELTFGRGFATAESSNSFTSLAGTRSRRAPQLALSGARTLTRCTAWRLCSVSIAKTSRLFPMSVFGLRGSGQR